MHISLGIERALDVRRWQHKERCAERRCSHVTRVQSNKRRSPQPGDSDPKPWQLNQLHSGHDKLHLNPPKLRPLAKELPNDRILDWRSFRAKLVYTERSSQCRHVRRASPAPRHFNSSTWAHELPGPEVGCVLVAKQDGMDFFDRTVVLLAAQDPVHGCVGFVMNKPSPLKLREIQLSPTAQGIKDTFGGQQLQLGGPVHMDTLTLLHAFSGLTGAQKISEGVYYGGLPAAVELVRSGLAKPDDFKLMLGMTGWAPGQLEREIAQGAWHVIAAGQGLILPSYKQHINLHGRAPDALWRHLLHLVGKPVRDRANNH